MSISGLDHFNIRAKDLDGMRDFFVDVIGLTEGDRPSFEFPGYWLYAGDAGAVVHPLASRDAPPAGSPCRALRCLLAANSTREYHNSVTTKPDTNNKPNIMLLKATAVRLWLKF